MRRLILASTAAALGTVAVASAIFAQQSPPSPGAATSSASAPPASVYSPMMVGRGSRSLLRNGWDYVSYQQYEKALSFFREAEVRQSDLSPAEQKALRDGIARAQQGMREAVNQTPPSYAKSGRARPGAFVVAPPAESEDSEVVTVAARPERSSGPAAGTPAPDPVRQAGGLADDPAERAAAVSRAVLPALPAESASAFDQQPAAPAGSSRELPPPPEIPALAPAPALPRWRRSILPPASSRPPASSPDHAPRPGQEEPAAPPAPVEPPPDPPKPIAVPAVAEAPPPAPATPPKDEAIAPAAPPATAHPTPATPPAPSAPPSPAPAAPAPAPASDELPPLPAAMAPETLPRLPAEVPARPGPAGDSQPVAGPAPADQAAAANRPEELPPLPSGMAPVGRSASPDVPAAPPIPEAPPAPAPAPAPAEPQGASRPAPDARAVVRPEALPPLPAEADAPSPVAAPADKDKSVESEVPPAAEEVSPAAGPAARTASERAPASLLERVIPERIDRPSHSALTPELQREVDRIAQAQEDEASRANQPVPAPPGESRGAPADIRGMGVAPNMPPSTRLELPRAPSPTEARPIRAIPVPEEFVPLPPRDWTPGRKYWAAAATCHLPLYFQSAALERYGQSTEQFVGPLGRYLSYPIDDPSQSNQRNQLGQGFFSIGQFALQIALWPYNLIVDPPWEAEYDLGYYRPGDRIPPDTIYLPLTGVGPPLHGSHYGQQQGH